MTWWLWVLVGWLGLDALFVWGWWRFSKGIREWEDERARRFGIDPR